MMTINTVRSYRFVRFCLLFRNIIRYSSKQLLRKMFRLLLSEGQLEGCLRESVSVKVFYVTIFHYDLWAHKGITWRWGFPQANMRRLADAPKATRSQLQAAVARNTVGCIFYDSYAMRAV